VKAKLRQFFIPFVVLGFLALWIPSVIPANAQTGPKSSQQTLAGTWKFNRGQSDDPTKKLVSDENIATGETGITAPIPGQMGGRPDSSQNGTNMGTPPPGVMGAPGGMGGVGAGPMPLPQTAPSHRWETDKDRQKRLEGLMPAGSLSIEQKDNEFDFVDDQSRKQVLYTDGRKLRKSKDDKLQEFAARWDAGHLTYDEKRPPRGTITRTFELSLDGRQLIETMEIDNGSIAVPVIVKYVYDAVPATAQR
jgi:hypothetical protein